MSIVTITLSDNEDGTVTQAVSFEDGVNQDSQAHIEGCG